MIHYHDKPDQLNPTQTTFKTLECFVACFPNSPVP